MPRVLSIGGEEPRQLTEPQTVSPEMLSLLQQLRKKVAIGFVGGSDLVKQQEQLGVGGINGNPHPSL